MKYVKIRFPNKRGEKFISMSNFQFVVLNNNSLILENENKKFHVESIKILKINHNDLHTNIEFSGYMLNVKNVYDYVDIEIQF